jgi:hypothetical protein
MIVHVEAVYFQCARAIIRSKLWETAQERQDLPTPGEILAHLSQHRVGGEQYDKNWPERAAPHALVKTLCTDYQRRIQRCTRCRLRLFFIAKRQNNAGATFGIAFELGSAS